MISVIIPTYQPSDYIYECLSSLYNQTLDHEEYEIIIILNGPKFPYYEQLSSFIKDKGNFTLKYSEVSGVSRARNIGLEKSQGDYICFIDDDDIVSSNYLEYLFEQVEENSVVASNVYNFKSNINEKLKDYLTFKDNSTDIFKNRCYLSNACCKLIPKSIIGNHLFNENFSKGEDAIFMFSISTNITKIKKSNSECIYYRRLRGMSASRKKVSIINKLLTIFKQQIAFTIIYITNPFRYNFMLYLSRILAVFKTLCLLFICFSCSENIDLNYNERHINTENKEKSILLTQTRETIISYYLIDRNIESIKDDVKKYTTSIIEGKWDDIDYENQSMASWSPYYHLDRVKQMSIVHFLDNDYDKTKLTNTINSALSHWRENSYVSPNWWFNTIGVCSVIGEILILLDKHISDENWTYFTTYINQSSPDVFKGANKVDVATYHYYRGICLNNDSIITSSLQSAYSELKYTPHEGVQIDGSALFDDTRYIGGYGEVLFSGIIKLGMYTRGTSYSLSKQNIIFLTDFINNTYLNSMRGMYADYITMGRQISRKDYLKRSLILTLLNDLKQIDNTNQNFYNEALQNCYEKPYPKNKHFSHYFWKADYLLHCNEQYNISVGGTSTRIKKPECMNGENLLGSYLALGATSYRIIGDEYFNIFPTWNWTLIPGVSSTDILPPVYNGYGKNNFSGGVSDGELSTYVVELNDYGLSGKKGYYTTKDALICLGNSIKSNDDKILHTTVDQCKYRNNYFIDNEKNIICHNNIYYIIPSNKFELEITENIGHWSTINEMYSPSPISETLFSITIDHTSNNKYNYIVVPNPVNTEVVNKIKENIIILQNDENIQALEDKSSCVLYLTFFSPSTFIHKGIKINTDKSCTMMLRDYKDLYIADPTQLETSINLTINS